MVKTVKEAVKEVVEGKKQNIQLTLMSELFNAALEQWNNEIVEYKDIAGYQLSGEWVAIMEKDGTTHAYPKSEIKHVKHYSE